MQIQMIGNVFYGAQNMDRAVDFYEHSLGLTLKFRDGNRWAAFDVAGVTLALEGLGDGEAVSGGGATVSLRVTDLESTVLELAHGGVDVGEVVRGPHEWRVAIRDPTGNKLVLYQPAPVVP